MFSKKLKSTHLAKICTFLQRFYGAIHLLNDFYGPASVMRHYSTVGMMEER
jgi:hypothetical protein